MSTKQQQLDSIRQQIINQKICPELASQASQLVFGDGNPNSAIVFIGEAPGRKEDILGMPFMGAAGRFFNEMLKLINLSRDDVYITNIVKYRPPDNRDPFQDEKNQFLPFLQDQLEVIMPKMVVTMGSHATNCFIPDQKIGKIHGQEIVTNFGLNSITEDYIKLIILPLFHPAAALYNPSLRQTLIDDFMKIPAIMMKINATKSKELYVRSS